MCMSGLVDRRATLAHQLQHQAGAAYKQMFHPDVDAVISRSLTRFRGVGAFYGAIDVVPGGSLTHVLVSSSM
jgi:hypothetical protein